MKSLVVILAIAVGVAGVVAAGIDDSPGGQLLGVLLIIGRWMREESGSTYSR